jgi:hypothetical protein
MRKNLPLILALGAVIAFALPMFVLSMPRRADLSVPTVYVPGRPCHMPIKLDGMTSINGLRRLEAIRVGIVGRTAAGVVRTNGLAFAATNHNDSWDKISVEAHRDAGRPMPYAYLSVTLPEGNVWRGADATLIADARLVYPDEVVAADGTRAYNDRTVPITREFSFRIATIEEERDAAARKASWEAEDVRWNTAFERWRTINMICYGIGGLFVAALVLTLVTRRKANRQAGK